VRAGGPPRRQKEVAAIESRVTRIRQYHPILVPGQLQSREYARGVAAASGFEDPDRIAVERLNRQSLLVGADAPSYEAVVDERALWRWPGSAAVIREQVDHLITRGDLSSISIRVLPTGGDATVLGLSPFVIYDFRAEASPPTVLIETRTVDLYLSDPADVDTYTKLFDRLVTESIEPWDSRDYLKAMARRVTRAHTSKRARSENE
jgi:hypothetical protein